MCCRKFKSCARTSFVRCYFWLFLVEKFECFFFLYLFFIFQNPGLSIVYGLSYERGCYDKNQQKPYTINQTFRLTLVVRWRKYLRIVLLWHLIFKFFFPSTIRFEGVTPRDRYSSITVSQVKYKFKNAIPI